MPLRRDIATAPYDFADYITDVDDVRVMIAVAFEDGDPGVITGTLGAVARSKGMAVVAETAGLTRESLYKALSPTGNPEFRTVVKVLAALGLRLTTRRITTRASVKPGFARRAGGQPVRRPKKPTAA